MREFGNKLHMLIQCFRRIKLTKPLFEDQDIDKSNVYANSCEPKTFVTKYLIEYAFKKLPIYHFRIY